MKRLLKILRRTVFIGVPLILGLLLVCLDGVDYRPYFHESYHAETLARLKATIATNATVFGPLSAGFGRAKLSPTVNAAQDDPANGQFRSLPLAGYGARHGAPATGTHDELYVKAVALQVGPRLGIMLGIDALIVPPEVTDLAMEQLSREPGLRREQIYLSATHTHCGIGGWGEGPVGEIFAGPFQKGASVWFASRIVAAVREAVADLKPAELTRGRFAAPDYVRNRLVGGLGRVDSEFSFIALKQSGGRLGVLGSFAAHATVLSDDVRQFSADYPGAWARGVEQATGGMAVFLAGGVGSHSPVSGGKGFEGTEKMGQALAGLLVKQLENLPGTNAITFGMVGLDITMPPLNPRLTDGIRLRPWLARRLLHSRDHSFIQAFRLDQEIWASTPCDFSGELALGVKDHLRSRQMNAVVTSFNGDYVGYVVLPRYYHMAGYEPRIMSFFGPYVPEYFSELILTMSDSLAAH